MKHLKLRASTRTAALFGTLLLLSQCVVPYETARMLPKGDVELKTSFTHARINFDGESEKLNNGFGVGLGYGISQKVNLKLRFENISNEGSISFLSFGPKFAIVQDRFAAALPFSVYFDDGESEWAVSPMFLYTIPNASNTFEATLGIRGDKSFEEDTDLLLGFNLGFGFSKDLNRWAVRPDIGLIINPGEEGTFWTFGLAVNYNIAPRSATK